MLLAKYDRIYADPFESVDLFVPPLDEAGNNAKSQKCIEYVANRLDFNLFSSRSVGLRGE